MASSNSTISVTFKLQQDGTDVTLRNIAASVDGVRDALQGTIEPAENLRTRLINFNQVAKAFETVSNSVEQINSTVQDLTAAYAVQEQAEVQLAQVMRNTMDATDEEIQSIKDLCSAQQELGVIGDEVQLAGAQEMATYLGLKSSLETLIPVMNDMLAQQYGLSATGENAAQIATMLGKVMEGQTKALSRYGYSFTEAQEEVLKFGDEEERAAVLAQVVGESVGGMNAALAQTDSGHAAQLANALGDVKEQLGGMVRNVAPYVALTSQVLSSVNALAALRASVLALVPSLDSASTSTKILGITMKTTTTAARVLAVTLRTALVSTGIGVAIAALSWLMEKLTGNAREAAAAFEETRKAQKSTADVTRDATVRATEQQVRLEQLIAVMDDERRSMTERAKAQNELNRAISGFNARLDETGKKFVYNKTKLDEYISSLRKMYEVEGMKDILKDLGRDKAELLVKREEIQRRIDTAPPPTMAGKTPGTTPTVDPRVARLVTGGRIDTESAPAMVGKTPGAVPAADPLAAQLVVHRQEQAGFLNRSELAAVDNALKEVEEKMSRVSAMVAERSTAVESGSPEPSGGHAAAPARELTRYEELGRLIDGAVGKADRYNDTEMAAMRVRVAEWSREREEIRLRQLELTRPDALATIQDYDAEIAYQSQLLKTSGAEQAGAIQRTIDSLQKERAAISDTGEAMADIGAGLPPQITSFAELEQAVRYYDERMQHATSARARLGLKAISDGLERIRAGWEAALNPPGDSLAESLAERIDEITGALDDHDGVVRLRPTGLEESAEQIREITRLMETFGDRMTESQREGLERCLEQYRQFGREAAASLTTVANGWSSVRGVAGGIQTMADALDDSKSAWERLASVVDGALAILRGIQAIVTLINTLATVSKVAAATQVTASALETGAVKTETGAFAGLAAAKTFAAYANIPFAGQAIASGMVAEQQAVIAAAAIPKFADGGIVYGPTLALTGEYPGASNNPEVIAPLSKLRDLIGNAGSGGGEVIFKIDGASLVGVLANATRVAARSGRRTGIKI